MGRTSMFENFKWHIKFVAVKESSIPMKNEKEREKMEMEEGKDERREWQKGKKNYIYIFFYSSFHVII